MKKFIAFITISSIILFVGCQEEGTVTPAGQTGTVPSGVTATQSDSQAETGVPEYTDADVAAYEGAMQLEDQSYCDKITDPDYKKQCTNDLNDQILTEEAVVEMDESKCEGLTTEDHKEACKTKVSIVKDAQAAQQEVEQTRAEDMNLRDQIVNSGDYTRCTELEMEGNIYDCEYTILTNKALEENDISLCDKATVEGLAEQCKEAVQNVPPAQ